MSAKGPFAYPLNLAKIPLEAKLIGAKRQTQIPKFLQHPTSYQYISPSAPKRNLATKRLAVETIIEPKIEPLLQGGELQKTNNDSDLLQSKTPPFDKSKIYSQKEEIFIAGGGGAGRALPAAFDEAEKYGLDLEKVKVVCASSVGTIQALAITLGLPTNEMISMLDGMPTDKFQDWDLWGSITNFPYTWGWCKGDFMPDYFRSLIKEITARQGKGNGEGLIDPTFKELQEAGYDKDFRVVTTNLDKGGVTIFSARTTPNKKVADAIGLSCSVPILFPPRWVVSADGKRELHTDGGVAKNYPFGVGSDSSVPLEKQLGFMFVNGADDSANEGQEKMGINSFSEYILGLSSIMFFSHPNSLPEPIKEESIALRLNHNSMQFSATKETQEDLDRWARQSVNSHVDQKEKAYYKANQHIADENLNNLSPYSASTQVKPLQEKTNATKEIYRKKVKQNLTKPRLGFENIEQNQPMEHSREAQYKEILANFNDQQKRQNANQFNRCRDEVDNPLELFQHIIPHMIASGI